MTALQLLAPTERHLDAYVDALRRGWSPDTRRPASAGDDLAAIARDPAGFIAQQDDREGTGPPIVLPDGTTAARLPGYKRWIWDGEFCGVVSFRWQPGTTDLPPYCLGHIGYNIVPWKRERGYATAALRLLIPEARGTGLPFVELSTDVGNVASQKVILANGGRLVARFRTPPALGNTEGLLFRIDLADAPPNHTATPDA